MKLEIHLDKTHYHQLNTASFFYLYKLKNETKTIQLPARATGGRNACIPGMIVAVGIAIDGGKLLGISKPLIFNSIRCIAIANSLQSNLPSASLSAKALKK